MAGGKTAAAEAGYGLADRAAGGPSRLTVESARFAGVTYEMRDDHIITLGGESGALAVHRRNARGYARELLELADVWEGVRT